MKPNVAQLIRRADNAKRAGRPEPIWTKQEAAALEAFYGKRLESVEHGTAWINGICVEANAGRDDADYDIGDPSFLRIAVDAAQTAFPDWRLPNLDERNPEGETDAIGAGSAECRKAFVEKYMPPVERNDVDSVAYPDSHYVVRDRMTDAVKHVLGKGGRPMLPGEAVMHARRLKDTFTCEVFMVTIDPRNRRVNTWWVPSDDARDEDTVLCYSERIPMGFIVLIDRTKLGDEELSVRSCRVDCYPNVGCKNIMDDAQRRIHEMVQDRIAA